MSVGKDCIMHQIIGIPMGTNPAVFIANLFCFTFEREFIKNLIQKNRIDILKKFLLSARYVDDLVSIDNEYAYRFLTTPNDTIVMDGIKGVYPPYLTISQEQSSTSNVSILDACIFKRNSTWITSLYDKREHPPSNKVKNIVYPEVDSFLSNSAKYNVITSQLHRYLLHICSQKFDFLQSAKKLIDYCLKEKSYHERIIFHKVSTFLSNYENSYTIQNPKNTFLKLFFPHASLPILLVVQNYYFPTYLFKNIAP